MEWKTSPAHCVLLSDFTIELVGRSGSITKGADLCILTQSKEKQIQGDPECPDELPSLSQPQQK